MRWLVQEMNDAIIVKSHAFISMFNLDVAERFSVERLFPNFGNLLTAVIIYKEIL